jgi:hypothetical protein
MQEKARDEEKPHFECFICIKRILAEQLQSTWSGSSRGTDLLSHAGG